MQASQPDAERVVISFDSLDSAQRLKLLRDLPLYCDAAIPRPMEPDPETVRTIGLFQLGKNKKDIKAMETIVSILLDREGYDKAPFAEKKLANELSTFLWHFKGRLDYEVFQLLEKNFSMQFALQKAEFPYLTQYLQAFVDQLQRNEGPAPLFSHDKTRQFIRKSLLAYSNVQHGTVVTLRSDILESQLRKEYELVHDEYVPLAESLFEIWKEKWLPITSVSGNIVHFQSVVATQKQGIAFDENESKLRIQEKIVKITKHKSQWNLLKVLCKDRESQEKDWQFSELREQIDAEKKDKDYYNYSNQLRHRVQANGVNDFLLTTAHSVQINPRYLEES